MAALALADNESQARALSLDNLRGVTRYAEFVGLIDDMARAGILNWADEGVPRRAQLLDSPQRKRGLPRPLLAMVLGHVKRAPWNRTSGRGSRESRPTPARRSTRSERSSASEPPAERWASLPSVGRRSPIMALLCLAASP